MAMHHTLAQNDEDASGNLRSKLRMAADFDDLHALLAEAQVLNLEYEESLVSRKILHLYGSSMEHNDPFCALEVSTSSSTDTVRTKGDAPYRLSDPRVPVPAEIPASTSMTDPFMGKQYHYHLYLRGQKVLDRTASLEKSQRERLGSGLANLITPPAQTQSDMTASFPSQITSGDARPLRPAPVDETLLRDSISSVEVPAHSGFLNADPIGWDSENQRPTTRIHSRIKDVDYHLRSATGNNEVKAECKKADDSDDDGDESGEEICFGGH